MTLVLVTGTSGSGKSAACAELRRRGYRAFDTDEDELSRWFDNRSGNEVVVPSDPALRGDEWFARHTLRLPPETVRRIAADVDDQITFICGATGNEGEIWELFSAVVSLSVTPEILRHRLALRAPGGFGTTDDDLRRILRWHATVDADNARFGALIIDANGAVPEVVDQLLRDLSSRLR